jgi:hypothetical protein
MAVSTKGTVPFCPPQLHFLLASWSRETEVSPLHSATNLWSGSNNIAPVSFFYRYDWHSLVVYKPEVRELLDGRHCGHSRDVSVTDSDDTTIQIPRESTHQVCWRHKSVFRVTDALKCVSIVDGQIANIRQDELLVHFLWQWVSCFLYRTMKLKY